MNMLTNHCTRGEGASICDYRPLRGGQAAASRALSSLSKTDIMLAHHGASPRELTRAAGAPAGKAAASWRKPSLRRPAANRAEL